MNILFWHIKDLIFLRHKGQGLESSKKTTNFLFVFFLLAYIIRFYIVAPLFQPESDQSVTFSVIFLSIAIFSALMYMIYNFLYKLNNGATANAFLMISIGIDLIAACLGGASVGPLATLMFLWKIVAYAAIVIHLGKLSKK